MNYKELKDRFTEAKTYKDRWLGLYKELYLYVIPDRDAFNVKFNYRDDGKPTTLQIWDSTAMLAAYQRANDLHGLLLPQDRVWGKLVLDPHLYDPQAISKAQIVLDEINDRIFFYINKSNLSRAISSSNLDLCGGTAAVYVESISDDCPLYFRSIPAVTLYIEYSTDDLINTCWYSMKMSAREVMKAFPDYAGKSLQSLKDKPEELYIVNYGQIREGEDKFCIYAVLDIDPLYPLFEKYTSYPQIIIYRDRVRPGEAEGRGIGLDLLPTIRDLNLVVEYSRKNMSFKANPPMFYDADSYFNPYSLRQWAGAMIARRPGGPNPLEALKMPQYADVIEHIAMLQETVKKGFQVDPLGEIESPVKSATEISVRENRAQRTSSTDIGRLINELPKQVYHVAATILNERGLLVKKRQVIPGFSTKKLKFEYTSPLLDIQKKENLNNFINNLQIKQQFFGEGAALASVNLIEGNKFLTEQLNLPAKLFSSDEEIRAFLKQMLQQKQIEQQAQLPQPQASASPVQLPQSQGVTI